MKFDEISALLSDAARSAGIEEYEIYYTESEDLSAETLKDEISGFSSGVSKGVCFRCICGGKMGYASSALFEKEELSALVLRAAENAEVGDCADAVLFKGSQSYALPDVPRFEMPSAGTLKDTALALQRQVYASDASVTDGTQSGVSAMKKEIRLVNSHGMSLSCGVGVGGAYVEAVVNRDGESEEAFDFREGVSLADFDGLARKTVDTALSKLGAVQTESGKYDIVISGRQMRALLHAFSPAFSGKRAENGMSLLRGKEGERVASECVTLTDDPMRSGCPMQTPFDGEGVATYKKHVIERGVLKTLLYDLSSAKKAGVSSTGNGQRPGYADPVSVAPYSFYIEAGEYGHEELLRRLKNGIYITELKGLHAGADAVTGDFSIESAGFAVSDGKLAGAVKSFTVAGNFFELMKNIESLSDTVDFDVPGGFTVFGSPDVLVRNMSVAGK
ncbi:MAG: TldD/PmbA family protein [Eubacteriales bacterium]